MIISKILILLIVPSPLKVLLEKEVLIVIDDMRLVDEVGGLVDEV